MDPEVIAAIAVAAVAVLVGLIALYMYATTPDPKVKARERLLREKLKQAKLNRQQEQAAAEKNAALQQPLLAPYTTAYDAPAPPPPPMYQDYTGHTEYQAPPVAHYQPPADPYVEQHGYATRDATQTPASPPAFPRGGSPWGLPQSGGAANSDWEGGMHVHLLGLRRQGPADVVMPSIVGAAAHAVLDNGQASPEVSWQCTQTVPPSTAYVWDTSRYLAVPGGECRALEVVFLLPQNDGLFRYGSVQVSTADLQREYPLERPMQAVDGSTYTVTLGLMTSPDMKRTIILWKAPGEVPGEPPGISRDSVHALARLFEELREKLSYTSLCEARSVVCGASVACAQLAMCYLAPLLRGHANKGGFKNRVVLSRYLTEKGARFGMNMEEFVQRLEDATDATYRGIPGVREYLDREGCVVDTTCLYSKNPRLSRDPVLVESTGFTDDLAEFFNQIVYSTGVVVVAVPPAAWTAFLSRYLSDTSNIQKRPQLLAAPALTMTEFDLDLSKRQPIVGYRHLLGGNADLPENPPMPDLPLTPVAPAVAPPRLHTPSPQPQPRIVIDDDDSDAHHSIGEDPSPAKRPSGRQLSTFAPREEMHRHSRRRADSVGSSGGSDIPLPVAPPPRRPSRRSVSRFTGPPASRRPQPTSPSAFVVGSSSSSVDSHEIPHEVVDVDVGPHALNNAPPHVRHPPRVGRGRGLPHPPSMLFDTEPIMVDVANSPGPPSSLSGLPVPSFNALPTQPNSALPDPAPASKIFMEPPALPSGPAVAAAPEWLEAAPSAKPAPPQPPAQPAMMARISPPRHGPQPPVRPAGLSPPAQRGLPPGNAAVAGARETADLLRGLVGPPVPPPGLPPGGRGQGPRDFARRN